MSWPSRSPEQTQGLGSALATALTAEAPALGSVGVVVSLVGELGSGKTVFAKGVAQGFGLSPDQVASPTFVIANEYDTPGGPRLVHADLYRLSGRGELEAAGFLDWISPGRVALIEWGDRVVDALPRDHLQVCFRRSAEAERRELVAEASGPASARILARWESLSREEGLGR